MGTLFNKALHKTKEITGNEFSVKAEPYFVTAGETKDIKYEWAINNTKVGSEDDRDKIITFIRPDDGSGKVRLEAYIKKLNKVSRREIRQAARKIFVNKSLNLAVIGPYKDKKKLEKLLKI